MNSMRVNFDTLGLDQAKDLMRPLQKAQVAVAQGRDAIGKPDAQIERLLPPEGLDILLEDHRIQQGRVLV